MAFAGSMVPEYTRLAISDSESKSHTLFFFQFPFRIDIYARKSPHMQEEEIAEFGKEQRERERESLQPHTIINSTCANLIGSAGVRLTTKSAQVSRRKNPQAVFEESYQYPCGFD